MQIPIKKLISQVMVKMRVSLINVLNVLESSGNKYHAIGKPL